MTLPRSDQISDFYGWPLDSKDALTVHSRLGYDVQILEPSGKLKHIIILPDDTTQFVYLHTENLNILNEDLKSIFISYLRYILERYHAVTVRIKFNVVKKLTIEMVLSGDPQSALRNVGSQKTNAAKEDAISSAKEFVRFLMLHGYEEIPYDQYEDFLELKGYSAPHNKYNALYMMDPALGPFTKGEMLVLSKAIDNNELPLKVRLLVDLLLSFGLRPIQLSLLKRRDFIVDPTSGLSYLNIPRVKNSSRHRRQEYSSRILSPRTARLLAEHIGSYNLSPPNIKSNDLPIFFSLKPISLENRRPNGAWYWQHEILASKDYYLNNNKKAYAHHRSTLFFEYMLRSTAAKFPLSPRTGKIFSLNPYRFRYTVGTQAVMSGCTPTEVAELLDHASTSSVKHYFRFTQEMWEILESAVESRIEQKHFALAWVSDEDIAGNIYAKSVCETTSFTSIGKCASKSICLDEPAIACYACNKFCPNKNPAAHRHALGNLIDRRNKLRSSSSDSLVEAVEYSITGCQAAIELSNATPNSRETRNEHDE